MDSHSDDDTSPKVGFPVRASALDSAWRSALRRIDRGAFTESDHARLLLSSYSAFLAEQSIHLTETWTDGERPPAAVVSAAIELTAIAAKVLDQAVVTARVRGASWDDIGTHAGTSRQSAHTRWGPAEAVWRQNQAEDTPSLHPGVRAAGLDAWAERVNDPGTDPRIPHERRVSAALHVTADRSGHRLQQAARLPEGRAWNLIDRRHDLASRRHRRVAGFLALVYASLLHDDPGLAPAEDVLMKGLDAGDVTGIDAACTRLDHAARSLLAKEPHVWRAALERFVTHIEHQDDPASPHVVYWREATRETTGPDGFARRKGFPIEDARRLLEAATDALDTEDH